MSEPLDLDELSEQVALAIETGSRSPEHDGCNTSISALIAQVRALREALPDPAKLWALADWIDARFPDDADPEVQRDLRAWARGIMALGLHPGIMAKEVLEDAALGGPER